MEEDIIIPDLWLYIAKGLSVVDWCHLAQVSQFFRKLMSSPQAWNSVSAPRIVPLNNIFDFCSLASSRGRRGTPGDAQYESRGECHCRPSPNKQICSILGESP